jgi:hypothetical protein
MPRNITKAEVIMKVKFMGIFVNLKSDITWPIVGSLKAAKGCLCISHVSK